MHQETHAPKVGWMTSERVRDYVTVWTVVLLMSGQGFRYLMGLPAYAVLCVITVAAVAATMRTSMSGLRLPVLLSAFLGLAVASVLWSATRAVTALAVAVLLATTYVAVATVRRTSGARFMELLYRGFQVSLFGGVAFEGVVTFVVRHPIAPLVGDLGSLASNVSGNPSLMWSRDMLLSGGPLEGFVGNRNPFAAIALFAAITAVVLLMERRIRVIDGVATLVTAGAVHLLTQSATVTIAIAYLTALVIAALVIRRVTLRAKKILSFAVLACTAVAGVLTVKFHAELFAMVDRSPEASFRTDIWRQVSAVAEQRPEGWGYVGYWPVWEQPYRGIVERYGLVVTHAHNAFLDSWLQLGLIGLALLAGLLLLTFGSAWRLVERAGRGDTFIPLGWVMLTAALALQALTESRLLVEGGWYMLVALYCSAPQVFALTIVDPEYVHSVDRLAATRTGIGGAVTNVTAQKAKRATRAVP